VLDAVDATDSWRERSARQHRRCALTEDITMRQGATMVLAIAALLTGCASFPSIPEDRVNISTLVKKIECEIYQSSQKHPQLTEHGWLAVADLTLQVDDEAGIKPSLSYLQPTHFLLGYRVATTVPSRTFSCSASRFT